MTAEEDLFQGLNAEDIALGRLLHDELGQEHLFQSWAASACDAQAMQGKQQLLRQLREMDASIAGGLRGYLGRARILLADAAKGVNPFDGWAPAVPSGYSLEPGSEGYAKVERAGLAEISGCCFVLVAGGLGERLGYSGIKLELPTELTTGTPYLELYCRQILALQARYGGGATLPLAIMVSDDTATKTEALLKAHGNFGMAQGQVTLMKQEKVPALMDNDARIALEENDPYHVQAKPHGHGDVHSLLHSTGTAVRWAKEGRRWVFFLQDTNGLALHSLPALLGTSVELGLHVNSTAVPRRAKQAIGGIVRLSHSASGRAMTVNVEYNQLDPMLRANGSPDGDVNTPETGYSPYPGNINQLLFELKPFVAVLERTGGVMAEFVNPKYKDAAKMAFKKPTRLECMMQDYPKALEAEDPVGFTSIPEWFCFSPVKNSLAEARTAPVPACAASGEADKYRIFAQMLNLLGVDVAFAEPSSRGGVEVSLGPAIVLDPSFALTFSELGAKFPKPSEVHISAGSTFVVKGSGVIIESLKLEGALTIAACEGASVTVRGLSVSNAGWHFENLSEGDSGVTEVLAMRGYDIARREQREVKVSEPGEYVVSDDGISKI
eukprot:CAMPEP_0179111318 /NCGR_PEP_ID=MMETSP0796-20121207/51989_1 /TAXON_ID=73915 /ORGANISM="Pyrodinium bahamense, Strain pbaha01" /LENGTH=608 /DNA_ID=CAMNT_0020809467 /DNA_START=41 /DNA_END=1867 /DNA_ORIENTATION=-